MTNKLTTQFFSKHHINILLTLTGINGSYYDISTLIIEILGYITYKIKLIFDYLYVLRYDMYNIDLSLPNMDGSLSKCLLL